VYAAAVATAMFTALWAVSQRLLATSPFRPEAR
jgi:hypothetical protein